MIPHPLRKLRELILHNKLPHAQYVSQPSKGSPIVVGFDPPLSVLKKNAIRHLLGSTVPSRDGSRLIIAPPEDRKIEHRKIPYGTFVEILQPTHVVGQLAFEYAPDQHAATIARVMFEQHEGVGEHVQKHFAAIETAMKSLVLGGDDTVECKTWPNGLLQVTFPVRFSTDMHFKLVEQNLAEAGLIHFLTTTPVNQ